MVNFNRGEVNSQFLHCFLHALVVQKVDNAIHWINLYSVDNIIGFVPSLASKREHVTSKHDLIGYQMWHDWSSNISS